MHGVSRSGRRGKCFNKLPTEAIDDNAGKQLRRTHAKYSYDLSDDEADQEVAVCTSLRGDRTQLCFASSANSMHGVSRSGRRGKCFNKLPTEAIDDNAGKQLRRTHAKYSYDLSDDEADQEVAVCTSLRGDRTQLGQNKTSDDHTDDDDEQLQLEFRNDPSRPGADYRYRNTDYRYRNTANGHRDDVSRMVVDNDATDESKRATNCLSSSTSCAFEQLESGISTSDKMVESDDAHERMKVKLWWCVNGILCMVFLLSVADVGAPASKDAPASVNASSQHEMTRRQPASLSTRTSLSDAPLTLPHFAPPLPPLLPPFLSSLRPRLPPPPSQQPASPKPTTPVQPPPELPPMPSPPELPLPAVPAPHWDSAQPLDTVELNLQTICLQSFKAINVWEQNEGYHGTSDPQIHQARVSLNVRNETILQVWVFEKLHGNIVGRTSIIYDRLNPEWPASETACVDTSRIAMGEVCFEIRDDWPIQDPPLLNHKCVPLPRTTGEHTVQLDKGCLLSFTIVLPPPPSPPPPPPFNVNGKLNSAKCDAMLRDPTHLFRKMWDAVPWQNRHSHRPTCFARKRDDNTRAQDPAIYFRDVKSGKHCQSNWYEGNFGELGFQDVLPRFTAPAPALLGFDESIDWFCANERTHFFDTHNYDNSHAGGCVNANHNILSLFGNRVVYNMCRNLEWQACAAQGKLPGQKGFGIRFAYEPSDLNVNGRDKQLGRCRGWRPQGAGWCKDGYATDDIYYLEVCLFNQVCTNGADLFKLKVGDFFVCHFDAERVDELQRLLMEDPVE